MSTVIGALEHPWSDLVIILALALVLVMLFMLWWAWLFVLLLFGSSRPTGIWALYQDLDSPTERVGFIILIPIITHVCRKMASDIREAREDASRWGISDEQ